MDQSNEPDYSAAFNLIFKRMGHTLDSLAHESDRGIVLVGHGLIEGALKSNLSRGLAHNLKQDVVTRLTRPDGVLGAHSIRLHIARALGTISASVYRDANVLRKMRNTCAHHPDTFSLSDAPAWDRLTSLDIHEKVCGGIPDSVYPEILSSLTAGKSARPLTRVRLVAATTFVRLAHMIDHGLDQG